MTSFFKIKNIFLLILLLVSHLIIAQDDENESIEDKQAIFITKFFQYVDWPNEKDFSEFKIAVIADKDSLVFNKLKEICETAVVKDKVKKIAVTKINSLSELNDFHVLYMDKSLDISINDVFKTLANRPILLITKGYPFGQSMINFLISENDKLQYELNEQKCLDAGLKVSPMMTLAAVKSKKKWDYLLGKMTNIIGSNDEKIEVNKEDLSKIIKEQQLLVNEINQNTKKIDKQKEELKIKQKELDVKQGALVEKELLIKKAKEEIVKQQSIIANQISQIEKQQENLANLNADVIEKQKAVAIQQKILEKEKKKLVAIQEEYATIEKNLEEKEIIVAAQHQTIDKQGNIIVTKDSTIKEQENIIWLSVIFLIIVSILGALAYRSYRLKNKANKIILNQKNEIEKQHKILEEQHREITDSINYAKRIQDAILPPLKLVKGYMPDSFILYKPKDIVAGDFYWMEGINNLIIFATADCTGHGVPGAMVSIVCHNALNRAVKEFMLVKPNEILDKTREIVMETFERSDEDVNDGMDIALCSINTETKKLCFSGANNGLYLIRNGELTQVKPDKQPIGNYKEFKPFTLHEINLNKGDVIYTFSDGFPDQFGGAKGKKFMYKNFRELLLDNHQKSMNEQHQILHQSFEDWRGTNEQIDDVCIIGVRI